MTPDTYRKGLKAEWTALWFLRCKLYRLCACRYKTKFGEIDLVMRRGRVLVFVEVKQRTDLENGLYAVTPRSQERIARAAEIFLQQHPRFRDYDMRFDAVVVRKGRLPYHLQDAWRL